MNKEQQGLLDEVYKNYWGKVSVNNEEDCLVKQEEGSLLKEVRVLYQQEFINKCKKDAEFSEKWGLKIEERELSLDERFRIAYKNLDLRKELESQSKMLHYPDGHNKAMDEANIPTKLITITYNDTKIESYE
jgi:hypothetical protein